jgi:hypothetical protein
MEPGIFDGQAFGGGDGVERLIRRNQRYGREARKSMIALDEEVPLRVTVLSLMLPGGVRSRQSKAGPPGGELLTRLCAAG